MRMLFAASDQESLNLMHATLDSALCLTPLEVQIAEARTCADLLARVDAHQDDIILLDWQVAGAQTPDLVRDILNRNPLLRVVALLPEHQRQYRQLVWDAGACNGIPKEHMDQEWLSTVLCIMHRAMQREARYLEKVG
ncbi:MAG: response regulator transcription factor [Anaerolineales bacterium]|nr:response regulator transcription factor [Anaerolineales bacterium]